MSKKTLKYQILQFFSFFNNPQRIVVKTEIEFIPKSDSIGVMNKDLVEIYNAITDLKIQLPTEFTQSELDFPEIVVVGGQVWEEGWKGRKGQYSDLELHFNLTV